jgi:hypothetical protein
LNNAKATFPVEAAWLFCMPNIADAHTASQHVMRIDRTQQRSQRTTGAKKRLGASTHAQDGATIVDDKSAMEQPWMSQRRNLDPVHALERLRLSASVTQS